MEYYQIWSRWKSVRQPLFEQNLCAPNKSFWMNFCATRHLWWPFFSVVINNKWSNNKKIMIIIFDLLEAIQILFYTRKMEQKNWTKWNGKRLKCTQRRRIRFVLRHILIGMGERVTPNKMFRQSIIINFTAKSIQFSEEMLYVNFHRLGVEWCDEYNIWHSWARVFPSCHITAWCNIVFAMPWYCSFIRQSG